MSQSQLVVIRHGQTAFNVQRRVQGHLDQPLDASGQAQAQSLIKALAEISEDAVYCSDLLRTRETIEPYLQSCGITARYQEQLRERHFGSIQGLTREEMAARDPELAERFMRRRPDDAFDGGESMIAFYQRSRDAMMAIAADHPGQTVIVVTHGGVLDCIQRWARAMALSEPRDFDIINAAINRVIVQGDSCEIQSWGDAAHLPEPAHDDASVSR